MRIAWRTVGSIVARVWADTERLRDRFADLRRLGIDEITLISSDVGTATSLSSSTTTAAAWCGPAPGHDMATLQTFFDLLGPQRGAQITHVSADGADFISTMVAKNCPAAVRCADPFHVVRWATDALDDVRRQAWNDARRFPAATGHRTRPRHHRRPVRVVEEPGEPHRQTARQARMDRSHRPPAVPRLPAQRGPEIDLSDAHRPSS